MSDDGVLIIHANGRAEPVAFPSTFDGWRDLLGDEIEFEDEREDGSVVLHASEHVMLPHNAKASELAGKPVGGTAIHITGAAISKWREQLSAAKEEARRDTDETRRKEYMTRLRRAGPPPLRKHCRACRCEREHVLTKRPQPFPGEDPTLPHAGYDARCLKCGATSRASAP